MDHLQSLKSEKMRLEMELEGQEEGRKSVDLMIDIATIENEIQDIEVERARQNQSHDHRLECGHCGMTMREIRDCTCSGSAISYGSCFSCREQRVYEETERKRNALY